MLIEGRRVANDSATFCNLQVMSHKRRATRSGPGRPVAFRAVTESTAARNVMCPRSTEGVLEKQPGAQAVESIEQGERESITHKK